MLVLATGNKDKVREIKNIWSGIDWLDLKWSGDFKGLKEPKEDGKTLKENAFKKASYVTKKLNKPAVADDTGLFVKYLNNRPGIHSARYAGENATYSDNVDKLLGELKGVDKKDREAEFKTSVCLTIPGEEPHWTEGVVKGIITLKKRGDNGFGYDPVFEVVGEGKTYAQMDPLKKDRISHRYIAFKKMGEIIKREVAQLG